MPSVVGVLRRNRDFRMLFCAQVVSLLGDWFATVAILGLVLDLTGSGWAAGVVLVTTRFPIFLVTPLAASAADRFDRRRVLIAASSLQMASALLFLLVNEGTVWLAFVAQAAITALSGFIRPAALAALPNLVESDDLAPAIALNTVTWGAMLTLGASLGGVFGAIFGRQAAFVADAASFGAAALFITCVRRPMNQVKPEDWNRVEDAPESLLPSRPLADTVEAIRYARRHPPVLALLGSKMGFGLSAGVQSVLAVLATTLGAGDMGIGFLYGARGAGVLLGPFLALRLAQRRVGAVLAGCGAASLVFACSYVVVALTPVLAVACGAVAVAHFGAGFQWTLSTYGLQSATPDELRGRIAAFDFSLVTITMSASYLAAGGAAEVYGPRPVFGALAAIAAVWGATYLRLTRRFRQEECRCGAQR